MQDERRLDSEKFLAYLYIAQQYSFFGDLVMKKLLKKLKISEEELIELLKGCIEKDWLYVKNFNPRYFLRVGRATNFPVIISSEGIKYLKENHLIDYNCLDLRDVEDEV